MPANLRRVALILAVAWAVLFAPQLFGARAFVIGDTSSIRAFAEFSGARWHDSHQRTHWNPYIFAGLPATASLQDSRPQWLPDVLLDAFDGLHHLPGFPPLAIPLLVHLAGMIAVAALSRRLWNAGVPAMVAAGLTWGLLPGQLVPLAYGQEWLVMSCSFMPVVLLAIARYASAEAPADRLLAGLGVSLATACQFLAAHPQILALTLPLAVAFGIERSPRGRVVRTSAGLALFAALGLAMTAAIWWPAQLYNAHSVRGGAAGTSLGEVAPWSAGFVDLVALAWPWASGFGGATYWGGLRATDFPQFIGTTAFALGVLGLARRDGNRRAALLLVVAAALSALLALGLNLGPVYRVMHERAPMWSTFRVAVRSLIVAQLAFALLSARGFEHLCEVAGRAPGRWRAIAGGIAVASVGAAALLYRGFLAGAYADAVRAARPHVDAGAALEVAHRAALDLGGRGLMLAAVVALFTIGARTAVRWRGAAVIALITLMALDLGVVSVPFLRRATGSLDRIAHPAVPEIARRAAADPTARVLDTTRERMYSNDWIRWRAHSMTGNHPAVPRLWDEVFEAVPGSLRGLCALSIRYLGGVSIPPPDDPGITVIPDPAGGAPVWQLNDALPRAYAVGAIVRMAEDRDVLAALADSEFDPRLVAFTTDEGIEGAYPGSLTSRIRWMTDDPDHIEIDATSDSASFLVIADTWFAGWRATVDETPAPIHRVQHMLRGVALPPGRHRLRLDYEPEGWGAAVRWTRGAWLLWMAVVALALWLRVRRGGSLPGKVAV